MNDYYQILGLEQNCTQEEIKRAFKSAAMKHHPDRGGDQERFKEISTAYETLYDPNRRAEYDRIKSGNFSSGFNNFIFDDFFININSFDGFIRQRIRRNKDLHINCQISLLDSYLGKKLEASFTLPSGKNQKVLIDIPAGINHGSSIRYNNLGDDSITGVPRGNLTVTVLVQSNPIFFREDDNLCTTVDINPIESIIGCIRVIKSITDQEFTFNIKPGTETGREYKIQDQGFYNLQTGKRGKFIIKVNIRTPIITDKTLLEKLKQLNAELIGN